MNTELERNLDILIDCVLKDLGTTDRTVAMQKAARRVQQERAKQKTQDDENTRRRHYAGLAMQALVGTGFGAFHDELRADLLAMRAFDIAEAMVAEAKKREDGRVE